MKPKTALEKRHHDRVAQMECLLCGDRPVCVHHVVSDGFKRLSKDHKRVVPLCPRCHQYAPHAVHKIGHAAFNELLGYNQLDKAAELWNA